MKSIQQIFQYSSLLLLLLVFSSCSSQPPQKVEENTLNAPAGTSASAKMTDSQDPTVLPVEYQKPSYMVGNQQPQDDKGLAQSDVVLKVGATIRSTTGPQPLRDILKRLANIKGMNISWASDVDQNALVDVDINANDEFHEAIDHLLRQISYFHETQGSTLIIKHKETKQFHIAMPFISQTYTTDTGGDVLGGDVKSSQFKGMISVTSTGSPIGTSVFDAKSKDQKKTQFDVWANIESNLKVILDILETSETDVSSEQREFGGTAQSQGDNFRGGTYSAEGDAGGGASGTGKMSAENKAKEAKDTKRVKTARQTSKTGDYFIIDKPVGIVTVTGTRDLLRRVEEYLTALQKELYKQINIEAKIIEVELIENSDIGINWSKVLKNFPVSGTAEFGTGGLSGQVWPNPDANTFISKINLNFANFTTFLNALKQEGNTKVLSNPKISVMNGQPAFITVGQNRTYISKIDVKENTTTTGTTYTYTVDTSRILSGVGLALTANAMGDSEVVMNLVPVTSQLKPPTDTTGDDKYIQYKTIGLGQIGLPVVDVREMSTTVRVKSGEMLVIGGLIDNKKTEDGQFAPVLGDIPLIKYLFGSESKQSRKSELIILLKPSIL
jgi:MSHA type pilus biogenesis protein MshL